MLEEIMSSRLGEKYYRYTHSSGVTVLLYPMKGYSTITAQFSVKFGSIDNCCSIAGKGSLRKVCRDRSLLQRRNFLRQHALLLQLFRELRKEP